jgi:hypothetical protein
MVAPYIMSTIVVKGGCTSLNKEVWGFSGKIGCSIIKSSPKISIE